jgi:hypothetical protein
MERHVWTANKPTLGDSLRNSNDQDVASGATLGDTQICLSGSRIVVLNNYVWYTAYTQHLGDSCVSVLRLVLAAIIAREEWAS